MTTPPSSPARLADELAALGARLTQIGLEVRSLQHGAVAPHRPAPWPPSVAGPPPGWVPAGPVPWPQAPPSPGPTAPPPPPAPAPRPGPLARDGAGSRLLAWVGGAVTLLGVLLLLVLAVQRGWLSPLPRVLGGAGIGLALVAVALRVHRIPAGRAGAVTLAATGVAALYLDVVAATVLYAYLPVAVGLAAGVVVACGGLLLAHRWAAQPLAVAVVVGAAVLAPVLTEVDVVPLVGFLLVLQLVALPVQLRHRWAGLTVVAAAPPLLAGLALDVVAAVDEATLRIALAVPVITVAALGAATLSAWRSHGSGALDRASLSVLAASPAPLLLLGPSLSRPVGTAAVGVLAAVLLALWTGVRFGREVLPRPFGTLCGALGALAAFEATALAFEGAVFAAVLLGEAVGLAVAGRRLGSHGLLVAATGFGVAGLLAALTEVLPPAALVTFPEPPLLVGGERALGALVSAVGVGALLATAALAVPWAAHRLGVLRTRNTRMAAGVLGGLGVLYGAAGSTVALALLALPDRTGFLTGHVVITVSWALAALLLLARGITSAPIRTVGMSLVAAAVAKLVLFDLATLDGVARVVVFLVAGVVLLAAGTRYARLVAQAG